MIVLYSDARDLRHRIEGLLADSRVKSTDSRLEFESLAAAASVGIAGLRGCSDADVAWLESVFSQGLAGPSCIVVTPLSLSRLQRLRSVESNRFHIVWTQEVVKRLRHALGEVDLWHRDPLRLLGRRILCDHSLHWSLVKAVEHICRLPHDSRTDPPANSVTNLANEINIAPEAFSRYWRQEIPLRCGPKQLLSWALLTWAVRQRPAAEWATIATRAGVRRRTLERGSVRLLGCTLSAAGRDPALLKRRFRQWVAEVSKLDRPMVLPSPPKTQPRRRAQVQRQQLHLGSPFSVATARRPWTSFPGSPAFGSAPLDFVAQARMAGQ